MSTMCWSKSEFLCRTLTLALSHTMGEGTDAAQEERFFVPACLCGASSYSGEKLGAGRGIGRVAALPSAQPFGLERRGAWRPLPDAVFPQGCAGVPRLVFPLLHRMRYIQAARRGGEGRESVRGRLQAPAVSRCLTALVRRAASRKTEKGRERWPRANWMSSGPVRCRSSRSPSTARFPTVQGYIRFSRARHIRGTADARESSRSGSQRQASGTSSQTTSSGIQLLTASHEFENALASAFPSCSRFLREVSRHKRRMSFFAGSRTSARIFPSSTPSGAMRGAPMAITVRRARSTS